MPVLCSASIDQRLCCAHDVSKLRCVRTKDCVVCMMVRSCDAYCFMWRVMRRFRERKRVDTCQALEVDGVSLVESWVFEVSRRFAHFMRIACCVFEGMYFLRCQRSVWRIFHSVLFVYGVRVWWSLSSSNRCVEVVDVVACYRGVVPVVSYASSTVTLVNG